MTHRPQERPVPERPGNWIELANSMYVFAPSVYARIGDHLGPPLMQRNCRLATFSPVGSVVAEAPNDDVLLVGLPLRLRIVRIIEGHKRHPGGLRADQLDRVGAPVCLDIQRRHQAGIGGLDDEMRRLRSAVARQSRA